MQTNELRWSEGSSSARGQLRELRRNELAAIAAGLERITANKMSEEKGAQHH